MSEPGVEHRLSLGSERPGEASVGRLPRSASVGKRILARRGDSHRHRAPSRRSLGRRRPPAVLQDRQAAADRRAFGEKDVGDLGGSHSRFAEHEQAQDLELRHGHAELAQFAVEAPGGVAMEACECDGPRRRRADPRCPSDLAARHGVRACLRGRDRRGAHGRAIESSWSAERGFARMSAPRILVTGAGGKTSGAVGTQLLDQGAKVRARVCPVECVWSW